MSQSIHEANKWMVFSGKVWFMAAATGQLLFAFYIAVFYGRSTATGHLEKWNKVMPTGLIDGDLIGNIVLGLHILLAFIITVGGPIQIIPYLRNRFRALHRWNGRVYMVTAFLASLGGVYMIYSRDTLGGVSHQIGNTLNALLIMLFAVLAWRTAISKQFNDHRRWAIRTFLMVNGVWFIRIFYGFARLVFDGKIPGSATNLEGPTDIFIVFANTLVPLALAERYFMAEGKSSVKFKWITTSAIGVFTLIMSMGIYNFGKIWIARLSI